MNLKIGQTPFDEINEIINSNDGYSCGSGDNFVTSGIPIKVDVVQAPVVPLGSLVPPLQFSNVARNL